MYARWGSFGLGMGLVLGPVVLGYAEVGAILHDVALGVLVCILTLAALEWPPARLLLLVPALWLAWTGRSSADPAARLVEVGAGVGLAVLALVPSARRAPRLARPEGSEGSEERDPARAQA